MEDVNRRIKILLDALIKLQDGIAFFNERKKVLQAHYAEENAEILLSAQDSMIHRFKCCVELFWSVLKMYLDNIDASLSIISPREIVHVSVDSGLLSENEGNECIKMVVVRNRIPDMYQRVVADEISH